MQKKQNYTEEALRFECSVNLLLDQINRLHKVFRFKYDKNNIMNAERINIHLTRQSDGKGSFPDAEAFHERKIAVLDAKNHSRTKIYISQVNKLLGDGTVRKTKRGILVVQQDACLSKPAYEKCMKERFSLVRLTKREAQSKMTSIPKDIDPSSYNEEYLTVKNRNRLNKALAQQFFKIISPEILIKKDGCISKRSRVWKDIENQSDRDLEKKYGLTFETKKQKGEGNDERVVEKKCLAYMKFRAYIKERDRKYIINYAQDDQQKTYNKIRADLKKQEESKDNEKGRNEEDEEEEEEEEEKEQQKEGVEESTTDEEGEDPKDLPQYLATIKSDQELTDVDPNYFDENTEE